MMADDRRRRTRAAKSVSDVEAGDYVRRSLGSRRVGLVEWVNADGFAWVLWSPDRRDYLPLAALRKIRPVGRKFDTMP